ncbi:MAG: ZIP family metal transporter [Paracoccaceae bacterium]|nr:ZIP family metal transporter [Paracoccaceae bacterium]
MDDSLNLILMGGFASLLAGLMTGVGAMLVLFGKSISRRTNDALLGFAAGVMLSASFFSLIIPGIQAGEDIYGSITPAAFAAAAGILIGVIAIAALNEFLPHQHFIKGPEGSDPGTLSKIWLFVLTITIHNFPEGMAVGIGFGGGNITNGISLATGIGLQNAPEGLAVAVALRANGYSKSKAFLIALLTGLVEPVGGLIGISALHISIYVLPLGLTFAAGAMLYIISHEIIPETHRYGNQNAATAGLAIGVVLMMLLDVILG